MKQLIALIIITLISSRTRAQESVKELFAIENGDSISVTYLDRVDVIEDLTPKQRRSRRRHRRRYTRLYHRVKKVYPLAKIAGDKLKRHNEHYMTIVDKKRRKEYSKKVEKELIAEFEKRIRRLSIKDGAILIKLIDREAGIVSYDIIKEFRGGLTALFWQSIARIFGQNLKDQYDKEEDIMIEKIIEQLKSEQRSTQNRDPLQSI